MPQKQPRVTAHIIKANAGTKPVEKTGTPQQLSGNKEVFTSEWLEPPLALPGLKTNVTHSSILPQCIRAYKGNIAGFGIGVTYKAGITDETPGAVEEFERAEEVIKLLNMDRDIKEVFEHIIEARETYGIAYVEVLRNLAGEVDGIEFIRDTDSIRKTAPLGNYVDVEYPFKDRTEIRKRRFCKYRQTLGTKTVYFKEVGDPRPMDKRDGNYKDEVAPEHQASEIMEFSIGSEAYGEIRWIGQILGIDGSRKAEGLNNRYFSDGRHTPLLILIKGGSLTDDSIAKLQEYMNDIKGESGQHAFMILEAESTESQTMLDGEKKIEIEVVPLAGILQKDELFQGYIDNNRRRVQSSFLLPDIYVGYTTDFNRATAETAMKVTEEQVFQPERVSLAWLVNNKLLKDYNFKYVEAYFLSPNINNPDDLTKLLNICERAGGLTPNKAKEIAHKALGEVSEDYPDKWGEYPLSYWQTAGLAAEGMPSASATESILGQLAKQAQLAASEGYSVVADVIKDIRAILADAAEGESDDI